MVRDRNSEFSSYVTCGDLDAVMHKESEACAVCRPLLRSLITEAYQSSDPDKFFKAMSELYPIRAREAVYHEVPAIMKEAMDDVRLLLEMLKKGTA